MSKKEIISAIERTIEETRTYERQNPEDFTNHMVMDEWRRDLEAKLDLYDATHPGPLRAIAISIIAPIGLLLSPVVLAGGLAYVGGRKIYEIVRNRIKK